MSFMPLCATVLELFTLKDQFTILVIELDGEHQSCMESDSNLADLSAIHFPVDSVRMTVISTHVVTRLSLSILELDLMKRPMAPMLEPDLLYLPQCCFWIIEFMLRRERLKVLWVALVSNRLELLDGCGLLHWRDISQQILLNNILGLSQVVLQGA